MKEKILIQRDNLFKYLIDCMIEVLVKRKYNKWDLQNQKAAKNANALKCAIKGGVNIVIDEKLLYNKTEDNFGIDNQ